MPLRFSLPQVRSRPGLGHRGRVAGRKRFVERLIEVRILIGLLRLGLGFLVHGNFSGSPFRNQLRMSVGRIIPLFLSCENTFFQPLGIREVPALIATSLEKQA
jgi:hypothetical protein